MILVTGATGLIGTEVLRRLSQAGVPVRALTRNLKKAQPMPGVTWVAGDLGKPATLPSAFEGTEALFLLTHYLDDMVELQHNAIAAAVAAGVNHVVKVSAFAASDHSKAPIGQWHYQVEKELEESGLAWTMLRPHHFMQVSGGLVLAAMGWGLLKDDAPQAKTQPAAIERADLGLLEQKVFYPFTFPLTAGPGSIVVMYSRRQ